MAERHVFVEDLAQALRAWSTDPRLPLTTFVVMGVQLLPTTVLGTIDVTELPGMLPFYLALFSLVAAPFTAGYVGTERIWYLRIFRGRRFEAGEILVTSWKLCGRYIALALITCLPFLPLAAWIRDPNTPVKFGLFIGATVLYDLALTFATPALAYSTPSASEALRVNFRLIREHWPTTAFYVFVPSLAAVILLRSIPEGVLPIAAAVTLTIASVFANLLFKGATAAFYLRLHPEVLDDGAVNVRPASRYEEQIPQR